VNFREGAAVQIFVSACLAFFLFSSIACERTTTTLPTANENLLDVTRVPAVVDLTYSFDESTIYWPTDTEGFRHERVFYGHTEGGYWYATFNLAASEHGGTHLDAPIHFAEGRQSVEQIPIERLVAPGVKINIVEQATRDRDYRLTAADIIQWESRAGRIPERSIVLIETGWGGYWGDRLMYLGSDRQGDASDLHFPGIGQDAAELLVERRVGLVGIDTASLDHGPSKDFITHQVLNGAEIAGLENVANFSQLPERGFLIVALPMKIAGGSGAPCRIVALLNR
jgi:kynurenine formamidase